MSGFAAPSVQADWVIIGLRHGDRCVLYASRTLTHVELTMRLEADWSYGPWPTHPPDPRVEASLEFHDYVTVTGRSYRDCLVQLFGMGEPGRWRGTEADAVVLDEAPTIQLVEGPRALGSG